MVYLVSIAYENRNTLKNFLFIDMIVKLEASIAFLIFFICKKCLMLIE